MTGKSRLRWVLFAVAGVVLALLLGFVALPLSMPRPTPVRAVVMDDFAPTDVRTFRPAPAPAPVAQPLPVRADLPEGHDEHWDRAHERADWTGGATVTCDISSLLPDDHASVFSDIPSVFLDMDEGMHLDAAVDVVSRFNTPVVGGRITFTVQEDSGTARVLLPRDPPDEPTPDDAMRRMRGVWGKLRWSGATPGSTVACDGAWTEPTGRLLLTLLDDRGRAFTADGQDPFASRPLMVVRGCGFMVPMVFGIEPVEIDVPAGRCGVQIERRNSSFPLIVNRGEAILLDIQPGARTQASLRVPPEPPLYQPPDLVELSTAADVAAFFGSEAAADAMDELIQKILNGEWDPQMFEEIKAQANEHAASREEPEDFEPDEVLVEEPVDEAW